MTARDRSDDRTDAQDNYVARNARKPVMSGSERAWIARMLHSDLPPTNVSVDPLAELDDAELSDRDRDDAIRRERARRGGVR